MSRTSTESDALWSVIIPVKDTHAAKTRLRGLGQRERASLAVAFAYDVARAALDCRLVNRVVVVTNDAGVAGELGALGAVVVPDQPARGLNAAIQRGVRSARAALPETPVAALQGDLPALRPADLTAAFLAGAAFPRWFVADADGSGTTMLAAGAGSALSPAFGASSRHAHCEGGAVELVTTGLDRLRRDVDTEDHLREAVRFGVGIRTQGALRRLDAIESLGA